MNDAWNIPGWTVQNGNWGPFGTSSPTSSLPADVVTVTVTGHILDNDGRTGSGRYIFHPRVDTLVDPTSGVIIRLKDRVVDVVDGTFSVVLIASDNTNFSPQGFTYEVRGVVSGKPQDPFDLLLPKAVTAVELGSLVPVAATIGTVYTPAVMKLNNKTGPAVTLSAADVGADAAGAATAAQTAAASDATAKVNLHTGATDPHGDRADAAAKYLPKTGGVVTGPVTLHGANLTVERDDAENPGAYRLRVTGGGLDFEIGRLDVNFSVFDNADFSGTQHNVLRLEPAGPHLIGRVQIGTSPYNAVHDIDPGTGVAGVGAKNGLVNIRLAGFKGTAGAPTSGTWAVGDVVLDSAGAWHLCTAAGTPGTWT